MDQTNVRVELHIFHKDMVKGHKDSIDIQISVDSPLLNLPFSLSWL